MPETAEAEYFDLKRNLAIFTSIFSGSRVFCAEIYVSATAITDAVGQLIIVRAPHMLSALKFGSGSSYADLGQSALHRCAPSAILAWHNGIAIRHYCNPHAFFFVMAVGNIDIVRKG